MLDQTTIQTEIKSPYLTGTKIQYAWDSTSLGLIKTCPRLYQYTMLDGWSPKGESVHLRFGQEYHKALEDYDILTLQEGLDREEAIRETVLRVLQRVQGWEVDRSSRAGKYKNRETLVGLILDYFDHYSPDPAATVIREDGRPAVELSFRFELDWGPKAGMIAKSERDDTYLVPGQPYLLSGHLDRVVEYNGELFVMDRKTTTTTLGPYYFDQYSPNNQMTLYTIASRVILSAPIKGVIIDAAQILLEKPNHFQRGLTYRTDDQTNEWIDDLQYWFSLAEQFATNNYWPMNDTACDKFGGCRFRGICAKSPQVRETFLKAEFEKLEESERWNPLKPR